MAEGNRKRPFEVSNFEELGSEALSSATVHGVITSLSPIKKGKRSKFFDGTVSDGKKSLRVVAFSEKQLKAMEQYKSSRQAVELKDCQVQRARRGDHVEIVLKSKSEVLPSEKKIDVSGINFSDGDAPEVMISAIESKYIFDLVSVRGKVHVICRAETLESGSIKQDVTIGDLSAVGRATIWGDSVDTLEVGKCYLFTSFMVKEFGGSKYLSMRKEVSKIEQVRDIGPVKIAEGDPNSDGGSMRNGTIAAVTEFVRKKVCHRCKSQVEPGCGSPPTTGHCLRSDCGMVQRYDLCGTRVYAKLLVKFEQKEMILSAFGNILRQLVGATNDDAITEVALVCVPTLKKVTYNGQEVITGVEFMQADRQDRAEGGVDRDKIADLEEVADVEVTDAELNLLCEGREH